MGVLKASDIQRILKQKFGDRYSKILIPEFTYEKSRIDAIVIDIKERMVKGFEIKVSKADWKNDFKIHNYTKFCSSITIVCPEGLITVKEIPTEYGLAYIKTGKYGLYYDQIKRPKRIQTHKSVAWTWTYLRVLELEFRRLAFEWRKR